LIEVYPGTYDEYNIPPKTGVTLYMYPGAIIKPTYNGGKSAIITDLVNGVGVPNFKVRGYGEFISLGVSDNYTTSFVASFASTSYDIEAARVSSFESWNQQGAFIKIKNAIIDFVLIVYLGGTAVLENCYIHNAESYFYYRPDYSKFICRNCWFVKDGVNTALANAYPTRY
jgi:hypothetical protein